MIRPLSIATDGYLDNKRKSVTVVTAGYIYLTTLKPQPKPEEGGFNKNYTVGNLIDYKLEALKREDEEILTIIKIFLQCHKRNIRSFYRS